MHRLTIQNHPFNREMEVILGSIGAAQSIYLGIASLAGRRNTGNLLLSAFFLAVTLRILKSLLWISLDTLPIWAINAGFLAHSLTGPLLYLYYCRSLSKTMKPIAVLLHFTPSILLLGMVFRLTLSGFWYQGGYSVLLFQQLAYVLAGFALVLRDKFQPANAKRPGAATYSWHVLLLSGAFLLQAAYFSNYILGLTPYFLGPLLYVPLVFMASGYVIRHPEVLCAVVPQGKYKNIKAGEDTIRACDQRLRELMANEHPYLSQRCTLARVAQKIEAPAYLLSHLINAHYGTNFTDYINRFRIQRAQALLNDSGYDRYKISFIARECGFNSLSAFNAAFRKFTGQTPSGFRESLPDL